MRKLLHALLGLATLALAPPAHADQSGGCMPTTGTYTGLTAAGYINAGFTSIFSASSGASPPANPCGGNPLKGQFWLNTASGTLQPMNVFDGTQWLTVGTLDLTGHTWQHPPFPTQLLAADGTLSAPGISFTGDPNTGIQRTGDGSFNLVSNGTAQLSVSPSGVSIPTFSGINQGQVILFKSGANLVLSPWNGNQLTINGVNRIVPSSGISLAPTGLPNSLHYIYAYWTGAAIAMEASTTAPVTDANGWRIKTGDVTRTLVGMAQVSSSAFLDTQAARFVASWFNQRPRSMFSADCCGNLGVSQTSMSIFDAATRVQFVAWNTNTTTCNTQSTWNIPNNGASTFIGLAAIAIDGVANTNLGLPYSYAQVPGNNYIPFHISAQFELATGYHYCEMAVQVTGGTGLLINVLATNGVVWQ